jgi:2-iminobutanoate/2-iminopropanoate deaminase
MEKTRIQTENAPKAIGPYSQAIAANGLLFCSGQIPLVPSTGKIVGEDIAAQTHQVMKNLIAVLEAAGLNTACLVKTTILLQDLSTFPIVNEIYGSYLQEPFPARATYQVAALPMGVKIEIEAIATLR